MSDFKSLIVMGKVRELVLAVYQITSRFPGHEQFGLTSQMRRAAISIGANIAEGAGRGGNREFVRFLHIARGSAHELEFHALAAADLEFLASDDRQRLLERVTEVSRMLRALTIKLRS